MEFLPVLLDPLDEAKPSLFELLAHQQLSHLFAPTCAFFVAVAANRYPRYLLRAHNNFDEIYALIRLILQKYYLARSGGTFTETFYGLKRERVLSVKGGNLPRTALGIPRELEKTLALKNRDVWRSAVITVGTSYLKRKLDEAFDIYIAPTASLSARLRGVEGRRFFVYDVLPPSATTYQRAMYVYRWFLRYIYPYVNAVYYLLNLMFSLGYLSDRTQYSSLLTWIVGTRLRRMNVTDLKAIEKASQAAPDAISLRTLWSRSLNSLRSLLPLGLFVIKLLDWYHQSDIPTKLAGIVAKEMELPPPIVSGQMRRLVANHTAQRGARHQEEERGATNACNRGNPPLSSTSYLPILTVPLPPSSALCPICLHPIKTAAVCQTGYVFDFTCISQWIEGTHERQKAWMRGELDDLGQVYKVTRLSELSSREGIWESGAGRCAVTGRRVLGGTNGIRFVIV